MMRRFLFSTAAVSGLVFLCLAVLAYPLGIDHDPAWGKGRIFLAILGAGLLAAAGLSWQWRRVRLPLGRLAAASERFNHELTGRIDDLEMVRAARRSPFASWLAESVGMRAALASAAAVVIIGLVLAWYNTAGTLNQWFPYQHAYFDRLGEAFLHGQLNLLEQPDPALLALADPYPYQNRENVSYLWDVSFYQGKFFLYWGPTPGLILTAVKAVMQTHIEDQVLAVGFLGGIAALLVWLAWAMRREFAPRSSPGGFFVLLLAGGLNLYMLWPTGRPGVYETAILGGQVFLLGGLAALFYALRGPSLRPWPALAAGVCLALAVGARVTLAEVVIWLVLAAAWRARALGRGDARRFRFTMGGLLLPLVLGAAGLLWYNAARFGNPLETGIRYQLGIAQLPRSLTGFFSAAYLPPNLFGYLARAPLFEGQFPFVIVPFIKEMDWPWFIRLPAAYIYHEPQAGLLAVFPLILFGLVPGVRALRSGRRTEKLGELGGSFENWWGLALLVSLLLQLLVLLLYFFSAMRYQMELVPVGFLLACLGIWQAERGLAAHPGWRRLFWLVVAILALYSLTVGLLGGFSAGDKRFEANNPQLYSTLREWGNRIFYR